MGGWLTNHKTQYESKRELSLQRCFVSCVHRFRQHCKKHLKSYGLCSGNADEFRPRLLSPKRAKTSLNPLRMLILCGLPGSGKSTLAAKMRRDISAFIINQDTLGTRGDCEEALR